MQALSKKQLGGLGEDLAERFLVKQGFKILTRNYWKKYGEIDIIAQKEGKLRFVEVKTVSRKNIIGEYRDVFRPEDNVHPQKIQKIARVVEVYLAENASHEAWQIDLVTVFIDIHSRKAKINFLENIVL